MYRWLVSDISTHQSDKIESEETVKFFEEISQGTQIENPPGEFIKLKHGVCHYILKGPEDAPLVIYLHGLSLFHFVWNRYASFTAGRNMRILMFDFYGHGWSSIPDTTYNIELFREQFEELLEKLNILSTAKPRSLVFVGHSMGGLVASEVARKYKSLMKGLVLVSIPGVPLQKTIREFLCTGLYYLQSTFKKTQVLDVFALHSTKWFSLHAQYSKMKYSDLGLISFQMDEEQDSTKRGFLSRIFSSVQNRFVPTHWSRLLTSVNFLYKTWLYQMMINRDRSKVFVSFVNHFPILENDHRETFQNLALEECSFEMEEEILQEEIKELELLDQEQTREEEEEKEKEKQTGEKNTFTRFPVKIIWGDSDILTPLSMLNELKTHVPHAEVKILPGDHAVFLQHPRKIFDFYSELL